MYLITDVVQRSPEWHQLKLGVPSASSADKIATSRGERSKQITDYAYQLAGEIIAGQPEYNYSNWHMNRGTEMEDEARQTYSFLVDSEVQQVGFAFDSEKRLYGCSPDGLVGDDGLLEIKCPTLTVFTRQLHRGAMPTQYFQQVQMSLLVTGREWCDFMNYHPFMRPFIVRVEPDLKFHDKLLPLILELVKKVEGIVKDIKAENADS